MAAPESPASTTLTSGKVMLPGKSHEWQDSDGEAPITEAPKEKGKRTHGRVELKPPDIEIPEFGGASNRKRYPAEVKLKAIESRNL